MFVNMLKILIKIYYIHVYSVFMCYMFQPHRDIFRQNKEHKSTLDAHNQWSGIPSGAHSGRNTKDRKNKHSMTPKIIIITTYFKGTI
jgi:Ca2+/H+ antiporter